MFAALPPVEEIRLKRRRCSIGIAARGARQWGLGPDSFHCQISALRLFPLALSSQCEHGRLSRARRTNLIAIALPRVTQSRATRSQLRPSWRPRSAREIAMHFLLREASETCSPCCAKLLGVPWARPSDAVAVESLVLVRRPDDQQHKLNCKVNSCARFSLQYILQCATKQRASIGVASSTAGLQGCCTLCWSARGRLRGALRAVRSARVASHRWQAQALQLFTSCKHTATRARRRRAQTTQNHIARSSTVAPPQAK